MQNGPLTFHDALRLIRQGAPGARFEDMYTETARHIQDSDPSGRFHPLAAPPGPMAPERPYSSRVLIAPPTRSLADGGALRYKPPPRALYQREPAGAIPPAPSYDSSPPLWSAAASEADISRSRAYLHAQHEERTRRAAAAEVHEAHTRELKARKPALYGGINASRHRPTADTAVKATTAAIDPGADTEAAESLATPTRPPSPPLRLRPRPRRGYGAPPSPGASAGDVDAEDADLAALLNSVGPSDSLGRGRGGGVGSVADGLDTTFHYTDARAQRRAAIEAAAAAALAGDAETQARNRRLFM